MRLEMLATGLWLGMGVCGCEGELNPSGMWMVGVEGEAGERSLTAFAEKHGLPEPECFSGAGVCLLQAQGDALSWLEEALLRLFGIRYVEPDRPIDPADPSPAPTPTLDTGGGPSSPEEGFADLAGTPDCEDLWELPRMKVPEAWRLAHGAMAPWIAILDGGFWAEHPDLRGQGVEQWDFGDGDPVAEADAYAGVPAHGTFIAGLIAGLPNNDLGRIGVVPGGKVALYKISSRGSFAYAYAISAMRHIVESRPEIRVVSYSLASSSPPKAFEDAVRALGEAGVLLVSAAGNCSGFGCWKGNNDDYPMYPGNYGFPQVISVAGSLADDSLNHYSHYGPTTVDLAAPGVDLCGLGLSNSELTHVASGTSYATPLVAGVAALVLERHPALSPVEVGRILRASAARSPGLVGKVRSGRVDAAKALETPMPRLTVLKNPRTGDTASLLLRVENAAAEGQAQLVLHHPEGVIVEPPPGWRTRPFSPGDALALLDWSGSAAPGAGTLLERDLAEHESMELALRLRSGAGDPTGASIRGRLVMRAKGGSYLNAPYDTGTADLTGFLSLSLK